MSMSPSLRLFQYDDKVTKSTQTCIYRVKVARKYNEGAVYLLESESGRAELATHEELKPYIDIVVGDSVIWQNGSFTVTSISPNQNTCTLRGVHQVVQMNQLALVKRATAIEFDNAIRKIYGAGSNMLETDDNIKMGRVEMEYGQIVYDEIIRVRKENTKHKR